MQSAVYKDVNKAGNYDSKAASPAEEMARPGWGEEASRVYESTKER